VSTLGEYVTTVDRIRIQSVDKATVWELKAKVPNAQIIGFLLHAGSNPTVPTDIADLYRAVSPEATTFVLEKGRTYILEVWGGKSGTRRSTAELRFE
jgi:hypothetical protein